MRYPPEFIERLSRHQPLSQVIGKRIALRRKGREFEANCPFHNEKTPSFTVNDAKNFYHCFGCAAHGDALTFLRNFERLGYKEAIERLANEVGLPLPVMTKEAEAKEVARHSLESVNQLAAAWFANQLASPQARQVRDYVKERGITAETVALFGMGYAPQERNALKNALLKQGVGEHLLVEAGLLIKSDEGKTYDRFYNRLMFPIRSLSGKVIAFGGRIMPNDPNPKLAKYLNSPETPLFHKGDNLFGYDMAHKALKNNESLIVVEGYMDVIALHQAGFTTAVAPLGTAITENQLQLLWRNGGEPIICLDGDAAGKRAMKRLAMLALPHLKPGFSLKCVNLPATEDPDSIIRNAGRVAMQDYLKNAKILSQVLWEDGIATFGFDTPEKKAALEQHLLQLAETITNTVMKQHLRDYFRNQLFALKTGTRGKFNKNPEVMPANVPDHLMLLEDRIMSLIIHCPALLRESGIEEPFVHFDFTQSTLDKMRTIILDTLSFTQEADHASLCAAIKQQGLGEKLEQLLRIQKIGGRSYSSLPQGELEDDVAVFRAAFDESYLAYNWKKLDHEIAVVTLAYQKDASEPLLLQLLALDKQKEALQKSHYASLLN